MVETQLATHFLLHSPFMAAAAQKLGQRILAAYPGDAHFAQRIQLAYWLVFSRAPSEAERQTALSFFANFAGAAPADEVRTISTASPKPRPPPDRQLPTICVAEPQLCDAVERRESCVRVLGDDGNGVAATKSKSQGVDSKWSFLRKLLCCCKSSFFA